MPPFCLFGDALTAYQLNSLTSRNSVLLLIKFLQHIICNINARIQVSNRITSGIIETITIDNGDALFETTGSWTPGTVSPGFQDDYLFAGCGATSSSLAIWNMPVFVPGNYKISAWFSPGPNRNENASYLIPTSNGILEKIISQQIGFNEWHRAQDGTAQGQDWQSWLASMYYYAASCVQEQKPLFFEYVR